MTPTSVLVGWTAWAGDQPIFYITNHRVTGDAAWIPNPLGLTQELSQAITGLTPSTGYDLRLQGSNASGVAFSAVVNFTTAFGAIVMLDAVVPAEFRGTVQVIRDAVAPIEFNLSTPSVSRDVGIFAEWTGSTGTTRDAVVPLELRPGTTFSRDAPGAAEWRAPVLRDFPAATEFGPSVVIANVPVAAEWTGVSRVTSDFVVPQDTRIGTTFFRDFAAPTEWTGPTGVFRDYTAPVDIVFTPLAPPLQVQNLTLSGPTTTSLLATWDDSAGPVPQAYTIEWKRSTDPVANYLVVVPNVPEPITPFAVSRTVAVPIEYGGHVTFSRNVDVPTEWIGGKGATRDFIAGIEFGGALVVTTDRVGPLEFTGSTKNVTRDAVVPIERRATVRRDVLGGLEFRATAAGPPPTQTYVEIDLGDASTLTNADGHVWGLANQSGGIATLDSVPLAPTAPCNILVRVLATNVIWFRDATNPLLWRYWDGANDQPPGGLSDPRYTSTVPLAVTNLVIAAATTTTATLTWGMADLTTVVGGGFLIRFKRTTDAFYGADIVQPCVGPGIGQLIDTAGRVLSVNTAFHVVVNGLADAFGSSFVAQLIYANGKYWYHNTSGAWFVKTLITDAAWTAVSTLTAIFVPSTATITMNNGHLLSLAPDSPTEGRIQDNGVDIVGGSGSAAFTYDPAIDRIYGLDAGGTGWYYYAGGGSWISTPDPTGVPPLSAVLTGLANVPYDFQVQPFNIAGNGPITTVSQSAGGLNNTTFFDDFTTMSLYNTRNVAAGGTWQPAYWYAPDGLAVNDDWNPNPFNPATPIPLYTVSGGNLLVTIEAVPGGISPAAVGNKANVAANMTTQPTFRQLHGYFECRVAVPALIGTSFAFWLFQDADGNGPQIDIAEITTDQSATSAVSQSVWSGDPANSVIVLSNFSFDHPGGAFDTRQFHTYGVDWQAGTTTFYIDRVATASIVTPTTYTMPLFPIMGIGSGGWFGPIINRAGLPLSALVDYVAVWQTRPF